VKLFVLKVRRVATTSAGERSGLDHIGTTGHRAQFCCGLWLDGWLNHQAHGDRLMLWFSMKQANPPLQICLVVLFRYVLCQIHCLEWGFQKLNKSSFVYVHIFASSSLLSICYENGYTYILYIFFIHFYSFKFTKKKKGKKRNAKTFKLYQKCWK
jgi:hypothetical protein